MITMHVEANPSLSRSKSATAVSAILLEVSERTTEPSKKNANRVNHHCTNASQQEAKTKWKTCSSM